MSNHDQCPTTHSGEKKQPSKQELMQHRRHLPRVNGKRVWRSMDEIVDSPEFRDHLEREFPAGASELSRAELADKAGGVVGLSVEGKSVAGVDDGGESRRTFLKLMGASVALAGVAGTIPGCRQPDHKILPYSKNVPEEIIPGKPLFYATSFPRPDGGAEGLLIETHEGRPTKVEGNPLHPVNNGKSSIWALASIMSLYDPDRLKNPRFLRPGATEKVDASWDDFRAWAEKNMSAAAMGDGSSVAFIAAKTSSPTREVVKADLLKKFPKATWVSWAPAESRAPIEGSKIAFGKPMREMLNLSKDTAIIVSFDRDFVQRESNELLNARQLTKARQVLTTKDTMARLYAIESSFSLTGGMADHRLAVSPSRVTAFIVELAKRLMPKVGEPKAKAIETALNGVATQPAGQWTPSETVFLTALVEDLLSASNRDRSALLVGASQPASVHALVIAMNGALGNIGKSIGYLPMSAEDAADGFAQMAALAPKMADGTIKTVVCINANPCYDAPMADVGGKPVAFAELFAKVPTRVTLSVDPTETAVASTWELNSTTYLEAWGDTEAVDGTIAPVQPMIAPLYEPAMSEIEFLSLFTAKSWSERADGYAIVRNAWSKVLAGNMEASWRRALHDGIVAGTTKQPKGELVNYGKVAEGLAGLTIAPAATAESLDAVFTVGGLSDGRFANIGWLQELPDTATRVVWDNPVLMNPKTAEALNVLPAGYSDSDMNKVYTSPKYPMGQVATFTFGGRTVTGAVWILPGMADNTAIFTLGYGRQVAGRVGDGVGFNFFPLAGGANRSLSGVKLAKTNSEHMIASTQNHWTMAGRDSIVRVVDLPQWQKFGDELTTATANTLYGVTPGYEPDAKIAPPKLNFAEQLGELSHTPENLSSRVNPYNKSAASAADGSEFSKPGQWGMTIDQNTCTGCGACTVACQSENNIPIVGKKEVAKGREMTWIRVDRYFTGDLHSPEMMLHQPVACVHCENAPCEVVCPVNATVHGPEGINYMVYNRCIGTRYCANNCPYKVRRFNFFDYGVTKFNGDYYGKDLIEPLGDKIPGQGTGITGSGAYNSINPNLIPPRLRQKLDEISRMQKNPDVTVRSRGVMEKCSYCIQRINGARAEMKVQKLVDANNIPVIPDGFFQSACQQACPSDAITFGDINDKKSKVAAMRANGRSYGLLAYLNTRPRTSHMVKVMNPNPALCDEGRKDSWLHAPGHHGDDHSGHDHGHDHGDAGHGEAGHTESGKEAKPHSFRFDRSKSVEDGGYAVSLNVLGTGGKA